MFKLDTLNENNYGELSLLANEKNISDHYQDVLYAIQNNYYNEALRSELDEIARVIDKTNKWVLGVCQDFDNSLIKSDKGRLNTNSLIASYTRESDKLGGIKGEPHIQIRSERPTVVFVYGESISFEYYCLNKDKRELLGISLKKLLAKRSVEEILHYQKKNHMASAPTGDITMRIRDFQQRTGLIVSNAVLSTELVNPMYKDEAERIFNEIDLHYAKVESLIEEFQNKIEKE